MNIDNDLAKIIKIALREIVCLKKNYLLVTFWLEQNLKPMREIGKRFCKTV